MNITAHIMSNHDVKQSQISHLSQKPATQPPIYSHSPFVHEHEARIIKITNYIPSQIFTFCLFL